MGNQIMFESVAAQMKAMKKVCERIPAFRISGEITEEYTKAADRHEITESDEPARSVIRLIGKLRGKFGAFIRNSAIPSDKPAFFVQQTQRLEEEGYDPEIIDELKSKLEDLIEAIKAETNGSFELRITAYTAMTVAVNAAVEKQARFDRKRQMGGHAIQKPPAGTPMARRFERLMRRKAVADEARSLFASR